MRAPGTSRAQLVPPAVSVESFTGPAFGPDAPILVDMGESESPGIVAPLGDVVTERLQLARFAAGDAGLLAPVFAERAVWEFPFGRGMSGEWTAEFVVRSIEQ